MLIVVTGSSGKLGRAVVDDLLHHGHEVRAVDVAPRADGPVSTTVADLTAYEGLEGLMAGADAVVHLGNYPWFSRVGDPAGFANNTVSTFNVFHAARVAGVKRWVNASSIQAYGVVGKKPSTPLYLPVDEDHPFLSRDGYQVSKAAGELIVGSFARMDPDLRACSLRLTVIYGADRSAPPSDPPAREGWLVGSMATHVMARDAARAVRLCLERAPCGHLPLNIVARRSTEQWTEAALRHTYGSVPPFKRAIGPTEPLIDWRRAAETIGFEAT